MTTPKYPTARWVKIQGRWRLSIGFPDRQHVTVSRNRAWQLLIVLRAALRDRPWDGADNDSGGDDGTDSG